MVRCTTALQRPASIVSKQAQVNADDAVQAMQLSLQVIRNAKLWCDVESAEEAEKLSDEWEWTLVPGFTASKILWLKNKEPENFERLRHVLLPHDFFNYHLTGRFVMEVIHQSSLLQHMIGRQT